MQTPVDDILLCAYVDGELDPSTAREVEKLAAHDPAVRGRIAMFRRSRDLLQAALSQPQYGDVPAHLLTWAERAVFRARPQAATTSWSRRALAAAALVIALGIGAAVTRLVEHGTVLPPSGVAAVMHEVAEYHPVYVREVEHLVEVPASRREHIEEWLGERVGLALRAPDLSAYGLTFQGARLVALHDQALAQLMYTGEKEQRVALCVTKLVGSPSEKLQSIVEYGLKLYGLSRGEHVFLVVGPAGEPVVDRLATDLPSLLARS
jgi:anti-sigma factor RsiW